MVVALARLVHGARGSLPRVELRSHARCQVRCNHSQAATLKRVLFLGTPDFATHVLKGLLGAAEQAGSGFEVCAVVTNATAARTDARVPSAGRSQATLLALAEDSGVPKDRLLLYKAHSKASFLARVRELSPDLCVTAGFGPTLSAAFLAVPPLGTVEVHASLLPRHRGAFPVHNALMAGDAEVGVSLAFVGPTCNGGPVLQQAKLAVAPEAGARELSSRLMRLGSQLLVDNLPDLLAGRALAKAVAQDEDVAAASMTPLHLGEGFNRLLFQSCTAQQACLKVAALHDAAAQQTARTVLCIRQHAAPAPVCASPGAGAAGLQAKQRHVKLQVLRASVVCASEAAPLLVADAVPGALVFQEGRVLVPCQGGDYLELLTVATATLPSVEMAGGALSRHLQLDSDSVVLLAPLPAIDAEASAPAVAKTHRPAAAPAAAPPQPTSSPAGSVRQVTPAFVPRITPPPRPVVYAQAGLGPQAATVSSEAAVAESRDASQMASQSARSTAAAAPPAAAPATTPTAAPPAAPPPAAALSAAGAALSAANPVATLTLAVGSPAQASAGAVAGSLSAAPPAAGTAGAASKVAAAAAVTEDTAAQQGVQTVAGKRGKAARAAQHAAEAVPHRAAKAARALQETQRLEQRRAARASGAAAAGAPDPAVGTAGAVLLTGTTARTTKAVAAAAGESTAAKAAAAAATEAAIAAASAAVEAEVSRRVAKALKAMEVTLAAKIGAAVDAAFAKAGATAAATAARPVSMQAALWPPLARPATSGAHFHPRPAARPPPAGEGWITPSRYRPVTAWTPRPSEAGRPEAGTGWLERAKAGLTQGGVESAPPLGAGRWPGHGNLATADGSWLSQVKAAARRRASEG